MLHLILAATLMAGAPAAEAPLAAPATAAPAAAPQLRIGMTDLAGCTALVNTLATQSPEGTDQSRVLQVLSLNWSLAFDAAQGQSRQPLRPAYDKALGEYQTQIANAAGDEMLGGVILDRLNRGLARCETIRANSADFFAFVLNDYIDQANAQQAAAATAAAPASAPASAPARP